MQMKKILTLFFTILVIVPIVSNPVYAYSDADANVKNNIKSERYTSADNISNYSHIGSYSTDWERNGNTRTRVVSDLFRRDYYKVSFVGILGSPQNAFPKHSIIQTGERAIIEQMSFFTSEELIHTSSITLGLNVKVNDISGGFGITWSRVTRHGHGIKITTDVGDNTSMAPFVAMPVYKVEARVREVLHTATSTRSWVLGSWGSETWTKTTKYSWVTLGYVGYYTYLGDGNDNDYKNASYLLDNHPLFSSNIYRRD